MWRSRSTLIYDGPFSENIENMEAYMLKDAPELTKEQAKKRAEQFLGDRGGGLRFENETKNTAIESYTFGKEENGHHIAVSITKRGGYVLYFLENRDVRSSNYDITAATEKARQFLELHGFEDMTDSYYETVDNVATINFAYTQNGVKCYSDLIKLRVDLETGDVIGMECNGYLMNHRMRDVTSVSLDTEQAKACVSTHLNVTAVSLAIIPKDSMREVLCYEFKGSYMDKNFIVYINAESGIEEEILLLIESPTGVLTI